MSVNKKYKVLQTLLVELKVRIANWTLVQPSLAIVVVTDKEVTNLRSRFMEFHESYYSTETDDEVAASESVFQSFLASLFNMEVSITTFRLELQAATDAKNKSSPFKLEKLKVPEFSGKFSDWRNFEDLFKTAVAENNHLKESEKMVYLKQSLNGEAKNIVHNFSSNSQSFKEAWELVQRRYANKREIVFSHIRTFDELKPAQESSQGLRRLVDGIHDLFRSLKALQVPVDKWDLIIIFLSLKKLDHTSKKEWLLSLKDDEPPELEAFLLFLERRASALADSNLEFKPHQKSTHQASFQTSKPKSISHTVSSKPHIQQQCVSCNENHPLYKCSKFKSLPVSDRKKLVMENHLCFNCMFSTHQVSSCPTTLKCRFCDKKHHSLLHMEATATSAAKSSSVTPTTTTTSNNTMEIFKPLSKESQVKSHFSVGSTHHSAFTSVNSFVALMETALVFALDSKGQRQLCRAFLDSGSDSHFISENCIGRLGLSRKTTCVQVGGMGGVSAGTAKGLARVSLSSRVTSFSTNLDALIMSKISSSSFPHVQCQSKFDYLEHLPLADPSFSVPSQVDILIGTRLIGKLILPGTISGPDGCPHARNTVFGWVLSGESQPISFTPSFISVSTFTTHSKCLISEPCLDLDKAVRRFWEIEEVDDLKSRMNSEDKTCEKHFISTHSRNEEGRYVVSFPFKSECPILGSSRASTQKRFYDFEKSLISKSEVYFSYNEQMESNLKDHIMEEIPANEVNNSQSYYIPHHIVSKSESSSTKHRIVFDASTKSSNGYSLNDVLMTGPKIQTDLVPLLIHFRTHRVAFSSDIVKFYTQFLVSSSSTDYQRLVWRKSSSDPLKDYRFVRITFGVTSAPYLAIRCLHQLAEDYKESHPLAYPILKMGFLVDNLLSGSESLDTATKVKNQIIDVLGKAKLKLRKWSSNYPQLLEGIPTEDLECEFPSRLATDEFINTIGILWNPISDSFSIKTPELNAKSSTTKRQLLSSLAKIFDPLGWLSPVTIRPKIILQQLWKEKLDWDSPIPTHLHNQWITYIEEFPLLQKFSIDRCVTNPSSIIYGKNNSSHCFEIFGFSDASKVAYSACIYLKTTGAKSSTSELILAKSKVAPIKGETIPRLELCGATLLVKAVKVVVKSLQLPISSINLFSDSTIVLDWIRSTKKLPVFEQNRVNQISSLSSASWFHVSGEENPADVASRGITSSAFLRHPLWLHGPSLILNHPVSSSIISMSSISVEISWFDQKVSSAIQNTSSFLILQRKIAFWVRFFNLIQNPTQPTYGQLTVPELQKAILVLVKVVQQETFSMEIIQCKKNKSHLCKLKSMTPFLDQVGILRVGGRLNNSFLTYDEQHPILLPKCHHFTTILVRHYHQTYLHPGPQLLLSLVRGKFWIPRGTQICSKIFRTCVSCQRSNPRSLTQLMGQLPYHRVRPSRPFSSVGTDYAGAFQINLTKGRNPRTIKGYVCIFVCLAVKAVHLEFAGDLSTESFLGALKRFTSRRGLPTKILSDGGRNFIGASNDIIAIQQFLSSPSHQSKVTKYFASEGVNFVFNPPYSPHHGGIFEAAVKSMKQHLHRVLGNHKISLEEFITLLTEIEGILNSRPITPISQNSDDFSYLSPGHFLVGGPMKAVPQENLENHKVWSLSRWQQVQAMNQHFWKRWSSQYLSSLQKSSKWYQKQPNLGLGTLVLLNSSDSSVGPQQWVTGRIKQVYPGKDNLIRKVDVTVPVRTLKEIKLVTYHRPITKISPLLFDNES